MTRNGLWVVSLLAVSCATLGQRQAEDAAHRSACDRGDASACLTLAKLRHAREAPAHVGAGPFMPLSTAERAAMVDDYERACAGGLVEGCRGVIASIGGSGEPAQVARTRRARGRACELGEAASCLGLFFDTREPAAMRQLAGRVCDLSDEPCERVMSRLAKLDDAGASSLARDVCARRPPALCASVARLVSRPTRDALEAAACDAGAGEGCDVLGTMSEDRARARDLFARGCQLGTAAACEHLGRLESP